MKKIKIMHVLLNLNNGGMESNVVKLINHSNHAFKICICCLEKGGVLERSLDKSKSKYFVLNKPTGKVFSLPLKLRRLFKEEEIDIVHTHNYPTLLYTGLACLFSRKPKLIHGEHGDLPLQIYKKKYLLVRKIFRKRISKVCCVSKSLKKLFLEKVGCFDNKVTCLPNGLDLSLFRPMNSGQLRSKYGYLKDDFILLGIGSFYPWKNIGLLIDAATLLKKNRIKFRLLLIGSGPLERDIRELVKKNKLSDEVFFLGYRADIAEIINVADVLVQPSLTEGMSNTIMEAMACGKPVVASDVGGNEELIVEGKTGFLFESNNLDDLIEKIVYILKNPDLAVRMGKKARQIAEERFDLKKMVCAYEHLYRSVMHV
ncbi:glycosyltransferase [Chlamydiota bacterium]